MAIVADKASPGRALDKSFCTYNRSNAGTPNAVLTPQYAGEIVWDTTNKVRWIAVALTNADWRPFNEAEVT